MSRIDNPQEICKMTNRAPLRTPLRAPLFLALGAVAILGCWQHLDSGAAADNTSVNADPSLGLGGPFPINTTTPEIGLTADDTGEPTNFTTDPCDKVKADAVAIRTTNCKTCHQDAQSGGLTNIESDASLVNVMSTSGKYPGWKYVVPGDLNASLIYHRVVMVGDMPPPSTIDAPLPHPSISDMSVLREWILCIGGAAPVTTTHPDAGSTSTGAGGATGTTGAGGRTGGAGGAGGTAMLDAGGMGSDAMADSGMTAMDSGMTAMDSGMSGGDAGAATACTGVQNCNNPVVVASLPFNTTVTAAQACFEVNQTVTGINCTNANGRRIQINNTQVAINNGTCAAGTVPAARNGGYCVLVNNFGGGGGGQPANTMLRIL